MRNGRMGVSIHYVRNYAYANSFPLCFSILCASLSDTVNPRRACAARVTVLGLSLSVCHYSRTAGNEAASLTIYHPLLSIPTSSSLLMMPSV